MINNMNHRNDDANLSRVQSGKMQQQIMKPSSQGSNYQQQTPQMLRESREKERSQNLANISKQIVSPEPIQYSQGGGYAKSNRPPISGVGLPPSGSPIKRKNSKANISSRIDDPGSAARIRGPLNIPKQPIKPPSNYANKGRHQSMNKAAPPRTKGL